MWRLALQIAIAATAFGRLAISAEPAAPIRVVTWNLQWYPGKKPVPAVGDVESHIAELKAAVLKLRPDILVLEEVASEKAVEEGIASAPELKVAVVSRFKGASGLLEAQQIAICSRFSAKAVFSEPWTKGWAGAPRGFAFASFDCNGRPLNVYGLHLKSNLGDGQTNTAKREDAIEQLIEHEKWVATELNLPNAPCVVCGDFNTDNVNLQVPSERTFALLRSAGFFWTFDDIPLADRITCPGKGRYPDACFDHIFVRLLGRPVGRPLAEIQGSDHIPVAVDFTLPSGIWGQ